ncbi:MAG TPA: alkaline phosphatase family protein [Desulfobacteria bacterium]|nr:alkaline phosphatase family protein [Desulfobacteria bacterium]
MVVNHPKIVVILLDGLGDRSYPILKHQTPLQAAHTPNLDRLATMGGSGLFHASAIGRCLPSEMAHYLLFGYDGKHFPGRGLLEAVGFGVPFDDGDVLSLAHLSNVRIDGNTPVLALPRKEVPWNEEELNSFYGALESFETNGIGFDLRRTGHNDAILVMTGNASPHVSDSDPITAGYAMARVSPVTGNPEPEKAERTAAALNAYLLNCHRILTAHPVNRRRKDAGLATANFLATQRSGRRIAQVPFPKRWGLTGMLIASGAVYQGLAHELGLDFRKVTDGPDPGKDLRERIDLALTDDTHDFFHVHTKTPDQAAHKGDPLLKRDVITSLDQGLDQLVAALETREDLLVAVTADHSTPSDSTLIHSGEPVPVMLVGAKVRRDQVNAFDEIQAAQGCVGPLRGDELMRLLLNYADRAVLKGHRLGPEEKPYFPHRYEPFLLKTPSEPES